MPKGKNGEENKWIPDPKAKGQRETKWIPKYPIPSKKGGQPSASWGEEGHYDVDNGKGERNRYLPDGTQVDHNNNPINKSDNNSVSLPNSQNELMQNLLNETQKAGTVGTILLITTIILLSPVGF